MGKAAAHKNFFLIVQQRYFDTVNFCGIGFDDTQRGFKCCLERVSAPIVFQLRIEHIAEPMQDDRLVACVQNLGIDGLILFCGIRDPGQGPAGHHDHPAATFLDGLDLFEIGADHIIDRAGIIG